MLEGDELEKAIANIMKRLRSVNLLYIRKVAMQIRKIGELGQSSINRLIAMAEMNADIGEIKDRLRTVSAVNARELQGIFTRAMNETYTDPRFRRYLAKYPLENAQRQRIERYVQAVYRQTAANMYNYSNTTAITQGYMDAIDKAVLAVSTGVASYTEAMRDTVRELGASGMKVVYESGYRRRLDTAVRQNIVDAVNQINKNASLMLGDELGYDAVEISAHAMSAPDHEPVQGHVFLLAEFQQMQAGSPFRDIDGNVFAGFRRPIGEWNCRHTPLSFSTKYSKRKWTDEQLRQFIEENKAGCEIGGKHKTLYEATQMMREIETAVRREKDTAVAAQAAGDTVLRQECQRNINALVRRYAAVSAASGAAERRKRMTVEGFRAVKVPEDSEKVLTSGGGSGKINVKIDEFVPCLKDAKTGAILPTEIANVPRSRLKEFTVANGWGIDWKDRPKDEYTLGVFLKDDTQPQGLISLRKDKGGIYMSFASTAPQNNKELNRGEQRYIGVGGHLFAAAIEESVKAGYGGYVYGFAANPDLLRYYIEKLGAIHFPHLHPLEIVIEGEAAQKIIDTYNYERRR